MKNLIIIALMIIMAFNLNGQSTIEQDTPSKWSNCILMNGLFGNSKIGMGLRYKSLYQVNSILKVGMGVGIESYSSSIKRNFVPLSIDMIGDVFINGKSPFYMISVGYGIALKEDPDFADNAKGGLMVDISLGYRSKVNTSQPFIAVGYRLQNAYYSGSDDYGNSDKEVVYKRWSLSTGILF